MQLRLTAVISADKIFAHLVVLRFSFIIRTKNKQLMKEKKKLKTIKKHIKSFPGVNSEPHGNRTRKTINFEVPGHEDITSSISALLEMCYVALDLNGVRLLFK